MPKNMGRKPRLLIASALLFLALVALPQTGYVQEPAALPAAEGPAPAAEPAAAVNTIDQIDCSQPPAGRRARLAAETEIVVAYRENNNKSLGFARLDDIEDAPGDLSWNAIHINSPDWLTSIDWPAITTADLDGDGDREVVMAYRDEDKALGAYSKNGMYTTSWFSGNYDRHAGDIRYIDVAAGNLSGPQGDAAEEVVIAFRDDKGDLHLVLLNGTPDGGLTPGVNHWEAQYWSDEHDRGNVSHVAVATGDLNGDGADDEIVVAFKDSGNDLQVMVFRWEWQQNWGWLKLLWWTWWETDGRGDVVYSAYDKHGIDVTTGDVDLDFQDEVIVGFTDGGGKVQVLLLKKTNETEFRLEEKAYRRLNPADGHSWNTMTPRGVSVASADVDGNGKHEVILAYGTNWYASGTYYHIRTFAYKVPGVLEERGHFQGGGTMDWYGRMSVAAGDIDIDGKAEIALGFRNDVGGLNVNHYDAESGIVYRGRHVYDPANGDVEELMIDMGDYLGGSSYGNYTGECDVVSEVQVTAVLHVPPHYSAYNRDTGGSGSCAGFGQFIGLGGSQTESTTTKNAGSVTLDESISFLDIFEVGPSFTYNYEKSLSLTTEESIMTTDDLTFATNASEGTWDQVVFDEVIFEVYTYTESLTGKTYTLRIPKEATSQAYNLDNWYSAGPTDFPDSWVPVGMNVARGRPAKQSSTDWGGEAERAVDGNTDGNFWHGSVTHTDLDQYAWWQVDLGRVQWLGAVQVWNRTDCCSDRLSDFYVFVSDTPFISSTNPIDLIAAGTWYQLVEGGGGRPTTVIPNRTGRYVRVQLAGTNAPGEENLSLAEVQVWGHSAEVSDDQGPQWPTALKEAGAGDTFTIILPDDNEQVVDGHFLREFSQDVVVSSMGQTATFSTSTDETFSQIVEESTAEGMTIGFEAKVMGVGPQGAYTQGSETRTSRALTWSEGTLINGKAGGLTGLVAPPPGYSYRPYLWVQKATSANGVRQAFLVLDYWVTHIGISQQTQATDPWPSLSASEGITPALPLIASPSHPEPDTWVPNSTVDLTWAQPSSDPATIAGYGWYLDDQPDTDIGSLNLGLATTRTYHDVPDGVWYAHVRAVSDGGEWSAMAHRAVRVDAHAPQVTWALDPPLPSGNNGWYTSPLTVSVVPTDGAGSGVVAVEVSIDGVAWQPYAPPWQFATDVATTTVWARATDGLGQTSTPVSTTFKIDMTPPSSKIETGSETTGVWFANVLTDTMGNQHLVLGGVISDDLSGRSGIDILIDGVEGTGASALGVWHPFPGQPEIEVNWYYTATTELGRGNHVFQGAARDKAGNRETPYQIAEVVWYPPGAPSLDGSSLAVSPPVARPGDEVTFVLSLRNGGEQEAHVTVTDTLPAGLVPVTETLGYDVTYDPVAGTLVWPARLLWPGEWTRLRFEARVEAAGPTVLENQAIAHASWPNTEALTGAERQRFLDREDTALMAATVTVRPDLPAGADVTSPQVSLSILDGPVVSDREITLSVGADADARWIFLREWTLHPLSGTWTAAQESGWVRYAPTSTWSLSPGDGVKYVGAWVADASHNVSSLAEGGLAYTNLIANSHTLPDGGRAQYRFDMRPGSLAAFYVTNLAGDPDLYIWEPLQAFRPNYYSNSPAGPGGVDEAGDWVGEGGRYLVEVEAVGESQYTLTLAPETWAGIEGTIPQAAMLPLQEKERPLHPLTISDPLSAGSAGWPTGQPPTELYLPLVFKIE